MNYVKRLILAVYYIISTIFLVHFNPAFSDQYFALAEKETELQYTSTDRYHSNSAMRIWRQGPGRYLLFMGAGVVTEAGSVQASAYGNPGAFCNVYLWRRGYVHVLCFDRTGEFSDSKFTVLYSKNSDPNDTAYAWAYSPKTEAYRLGGKRVQNNEELVEVRRLALGRWKVSFGERSLLNRNNGSGGNVQITATGSSKNHCQVERWVSHEVYVACFNAKGQPVDNQFGVLYRVGKNRPDLSYVYAGQPSTASYTANENYSASSLNRVNIQRVDTGRYSVKLGALANQKNTILVTAYGTQAARCGIENWHSGVVNVFCTDASGSPKDNRFSLLAVRRANSQKPGPSALDDSDGDGVVDSRDVDFTFGADKDNDSIDDAFDVSYNNRGDMDGDGVINYYDPDTDADGLYNEKDPDIDNDGIRNEEDARPFKADPKGVKKSQWKVSNVPQVCPDLNAAIVHRYGSDALNLDKKRYLALFIDAVDNRDNYDENALGRAFLPDFKGELTLSYLSQTHQSKLSEKSNRNNLRPSWFSILDTTWSSGLSASYYAHISIKDDDSTSRDDRADINPHASNTASEHVHLEIQPSSGQVWLTDEYRRRIPPKPGMPVVPLGMVGQKLQLNGGRQKIERRVGDPNPRYEGRDKHSTSITFRACLSLPLSDLADLKVINKSAGKPNAHDVVSFSVGRGKNAERILKAANHMGKVGVLAQFPNGDLKPVDVACGLGRGVDKHQVYCASENIAEQWTSAEKQSPGKVHFWPYWQHKKAARPIIFSQRASVDRPFKPMASATNPALKVVTYNVNLLTPDIFESIKGENKRIDGAHWPLTTQRAEAIGQHIYQSFGCPDVINLQETVNQKKMRALIQSVNARCGRYHVLTGPALTSEERSRSADEVINIAGVKGWDALGLLATASIPAATGIVGFVFAEPVSAALIIGSAYVFTEFIFPWAKKSAMDEVNGALNDWISKTRKPTPFIGNELTILSKHPIVARNELAFGLASSFDRMAKKGVLHARIKTPHHGLVDVFNTHLNVRRPYVHKHQLDSMVRFVGQHQSKDRPVVISGDFNFTGTDLKWGVPLKPYRSGEYRKSDRQLYSFLSELKARTGRVFRNDSAGVGGTNHGEYDRDKQFSARLVQHSRQLDHIFSAGFARSQARKRIYDWKNPDGKIGLASLVPSSLAFVDASHWGGSRGVSDMAVGDVDGDGLDEILIGRNDGDNMRYAVRDDARAGFRSLLSAGARSDVGVSAVALGNVDADPELELAIGFAETDSGKTRYVILDDANRGFRRLYSGGAGWGNGRYVTALAFGDVDGDGRDELALGRDSSNNMRYAILDDQLNNFATLVGEGGRGWGRGRYPTAMAFGDTDNDGRDELLMGRRAKEGDVKLFVLKYQPGRNSMTPLWQGGKHWGSGRYASALAFGNVDRDAADELIIGRNGNDNMRYVILDDHANGYTQLYEKKSGWGRRRSVTAISTGDTDGDGIEEIVFGRSSPKNMRYAILDDHLNGFEALVGDGGESWGGGRYASEVAFGNFDLDPQMELAIGRNSGDNARLIFLDDLSRQRTMPASDHAAVEAELFLN